MSSKAVTVELKSTLVTLLTIHMRQVLSLHMTPLVPSKVGNQHTPRTIYHSILPEGASSCERGIMDILRFASGTAVMLLGTKADLKPSDCKDGNLQNEIERIMGDLSSSHNVIHEEAKNASPWTANPVLTMTLALTLTHT